MTSFIEEMRSLAIKQSEIVKNDDDNHDNEKSNNNEEHINKVKKEKFKMLNEKYFDMIERKIKNMSINGKREAYINFVWEDFKANCNGLGNPKQFQRLWIDEITNPNSIYLPKDKDDKTRCLEGLNAEIWGNRAFTTHFTW